MSKMDKKWLKMDLKMSKNTVLGYKKGLKTQNIFSDLENMYFQLSNALSIVCIRCLDTKIHNIEIWVSRIPPQVGLKKKSLILEWESELITNRNVTYMSRPEQVYKRLINGWYEFGMLNKCERYQDKSSKGVL